MSEFSSRNRIDTLLKVETPEAVDIYLRPASIFSRSRAYLLDLLIRFIWLWLSSWLLSLLIGLLGVNSDVFMMLFFLNLFFVLWLYHVLFEVLWSGQTPGKRVFGLRVVNDDGTRVGWSGAMMRNLVRLADGLPFLHGVGMVVALCDPYGRRLGDMLASTVVVYAEKNRAAAARLSLRGVETVAPPVVLTREEQQAVLSFAERRAALAPVRAQELAEMMAVSIFGGQIGGDPQQLILGLAKYYAGEERKQEGVAA